MWRPSMQMKWMLIVQSRCLDQSAFALENLTTLAHFPVSSATNFPNSATVIGIGSAPSLSNHALILGSASPVLISWFSF
jgi:hypothetical protein